MGKYNFDIATDRKGSDAIKYCELEKRFGKADLLPAWVADMDFDVCPEISDALTARINHHIYGYSTVPDSYFNAILRWIDHRYGMTVDRDEISYIPGVVKGIAFAVNFFSAKGDKIVIQQPVYHPFRMVIEGNGRTVVNSPLLETAEGYKMDLDGLRRVVAEEHPTMMILCNPHNPIGLQWSKETLAEVAHICAEAGVVVVSDEIHGDLTLNGLRHVPFLEVSDEARQIGVMLGAPSKTFNIPGLVSSWCVIKNPEMRRPFFDWLTNNEFNDPTFCAVLAAEVAYTHGEQWLNEVLEYISANIRHLAEELPRISGGLITAVKPEASFLLWLDCRKMGLTQAELVDFFINHAGLALNDGSMFGKEGRGFMRFNAAAPRATIDEAIKKIADALATFKK
jgi:cystathionine beta-lyase